MSIKDLSKLFSTVLFVCIISFQGYTQEHLSKILTNGEIRIGMTGEQAPFTMKNKEGKLMGYEVELAKALAKSMGVKLVLVKMPFSKLMPALEEGGIDAVMSGMTITPKRNMKALFAGPYMLSGKSLITRSEELSEISDIEEANDKNYTIACLKGSTSEDFVRKSLPKVEVIVLDDYETGIEKVMNYEADAMVADVPFCTVAELEHGSEGLLMLNGQLTIEPIGMALPPDDHQLLNLVENYLATLELSGALIELEETWFESDEWMLEVE